MAVGMEAQGENKEVSGEGTRMYESGFWGPSSGPLHEQRALLTAEPASSPSLWFVRCTESEEFQDCL